MNRPGRETIPGWSLEPSLADEPTLTALSKAIAGHGVRNLLTLLVVRDWVRSEPVADAIARWLSPTAWPISATWFDKTPEANWRVPWHQDAQAPVKPFDADGWGPWSAKHGIPHVRLPEPWSSARIALRLHVDASGEEHGPLQILPGSHRSGLLAPDGIDAMVPRIAPLTVTARRGEVLVMHPLLLHRSAPAIRPHHRRVLHVEWCALPPPIAATWDELRP